MKMPAHIAIDERQGLIIDGRLFPHPVGMEFVVHGGPDEIPGVTVRLFADAVSVNSRWVAGAPTLAFPWRGGPFVPLDIPAERARLADLGRRIAATRARTQETER